MLGLGFFLPKTTRRDWYLQKKCRNKKKYFLLRHGKQVPLRCHKTGYHHTYEKCLGDSDETGLTLEMFFILWLHILSEMAVQC